MKYPFTLLLLFFSSLVSAQYSVDSLLQKGDYIRAIDRLKSKEETADKYYKLGKIYFEIGNYNSAIKNYSNSLKFESNLNTIKAIATAYKSNGNYKQAIHYYKKVIENDSLNYLILYKLGKIYAKNEEPKKAIEIFEKLHIIDPNNPNYIYQKALLQTSLFDRADQFLEVYKLDSMHTKSMYHLANFFLLIKDKDSSRLFVDKALYINPNNTKFIQLKVSGFYKQKKYQSALKQALLLDSLSPDNLFANQRIGLSYWKLKEYEKAKLYLKKALLIDKEEKSTYYYLGLLNKDMNDLKKAKYYFKNAIHLDKPDIDNEHFHLGLIAQLEKEPKEAIKHFKEAFKNNPRNYLALFELAVMSDLYYKDKSIALKYYEKYLERYNKQNREKTEYVSKRIMIINEEIFLKDDK